MNKECKFVIYSLNINLNQVKIPQPAYSVWTKFWTR